jgi:glycosidase
MIKPVSLALVTSSLLLGCINEQASVPNPQAEVVTETQDKGFAENFYSQASIYEVNVRQFSEAGTLEAVTEQLPRLKAMGVDIIWLMPIQPISEVKRKGELGSYYSIADYTAVHPDYGTLEDVKALVAKAHELDQKVILDWVANHTGWDHPWITQHPDWYSKNADGDITDPIDARTGESWGWTDVADLNYDNKALWQGMSEAMQFWLREVDMDGFRCDVAGEVHTEFWNHVRPQLDAIKPVFMLAEAEKPELQQAFDMSYGWEAHHLINAVAKGEKAPKVIDEYMQQRAEKFAPDHQLMMFTTNHDENSWNGTVFERFGEAHKAAAVLSFTLDGMPLIYSGQESAMDKRLKFFQKDAIDWKDYPLQAFYSDLLTLKDSQPALWSGPDGGKFQALSYQSDQTKAYAFRRVNKDSNLVIAVNLSDEPAKVTLEAPLDGYKAIFGQGQLIGESIALEPHQFVILNNG